MAQQALGDPGGSQGQAFSIKPYPSELHSPWMSAGRQGPKGVWPFSQRSLQMQQDGHAPASGFPWATASTITGRSPSSSLSASKFSPTGHHLICLLPPCLGLLFMSTELSNTCLIKTLLYNHDTPGSNAFSVPITSWIWLLVHLQTTTSWS